MSNKQNNGQNNNGQNNNGKQRQSPTRYHAWVQNHINTAPLERVQHVINLLVELTHIESEIVTTQNTLQHHTRVLVSLSQRRATMSVFHIMDKHEIDVLIKRQHVSIEHYTRCLHHVNTQRHNIKQTLDVLTNTIKQG